MRRTITIEVEVDESFDFRYPSILHITIKDMVNALPGVDVVSMKNSPSDYVLENETAFKEKI